MANGMRTMRDSETDEATAMNSTNQNLTRLRAAFRVRKAIRLGLFFGALFLMIAVTALAFPSWQLFGMPKRVWVPFFYLFMFADLAVIFLIWRCPACYAPLGDVFSARICSKCGVRFLDSESERSGLGVEHSHDVKQTQDPA